MISINTCPFQNVIAKKIIKKIRIGAIDTHVHSNPTHDDGFSSMTLSLFVNVKRPGLDGVVIKCHEFGTFSAQRLLRSTLLKVLNFTSLYKSLTAKTGKGEASAGR